MTIKKYIAIILLITGLTFTCSSCTGNDNYENTVTGNDDVRIGIMTSAFTIPLYYAYIEGWFEDAGLDVSVEYFTNGPAINEALAAGDIDIAGIGEMPAVSGIIANNYKIVAWMSDEENALQCYARNDSDIVRSGKGHIKEYPDIYGTPEEWKGKSVIVSKGTASYYSLLKTLEALGLSENDIEIINMAGSQGAAAFASGTGDMFYGFDPQWAEFYTDSEEFTCVATCENSGSGPFYNIMVASDDFVTSHKETLTTVIKTMLEVEQYLSNHRKTYYDAMYGWQNTYGNLTQSQARYSARLKSFRSLESQKAIFTWRNGSCPMMDSMNDVADFMIENQVITEAEKLEMDNRNPVYSDCLIDAINSMDEE